MTRFFIPLIILFIRVFLVKSDSDIGYCFSNVKELLDQYEKVRGNEIALEESRWTGAALVLNNKTNEAKANEIFMIYKLEELQKYRNVTSENPAAMYYYDAKNKIEKSNVFKIIRKMPKGANLNIHSLGSVSSEWLLKNFTHIDGLKTCSDGGYTIFTFRNSRDYASCKEMSTLRKHSKAYDKELRKNFELKEVRPKGRNFQYEEAIEHLFHMFLAITDAVNYKPAFEQFHYQMLQEMYDDNIMYAEVRTQFLELYDNTRNNKYTREDTVQTLIDVVKRFKRDHKDFFGVKFIFAIVRNSLPENTWKEIEVFKSLQQKYPKYIIGLDFVGWEDFGAPLKRYIEDFIQLKQEGYQFYFNGGETNHYGHSSDYNLYDALLLQSKRIAHAYALWKHPVILSEIKSRSIGIEICPVSNQISGLVTDLRNHPGGIYLSDDAPIVVGNDAPGFFGTTGLSTDLYYTIMSLASHKADLRTLKQLALNSFLYSALPGNKFVNATKLFTEKWNAFVNDIVREYETVFLKKHR